MADTPPSRPPAVRELADAIRLTREYVGEELLPAIDGWSWYDALRRWAPEYLPPSGPPQAPATVPLVDPDTGRPPVRLYEVRTVHGEAYLAEGDVIESGDGWFTLWADESSIALRIPEADLRAVRQTSADELEAQAGVPGEGPACSNVPGCDGNCCNRRDKDQELRSSNEVIERLSAEPAEARMWARHGYEIGQRHCGWTDHGVAPDWLTEGWPPSFDSCEHLKQAAAFDEALTRVRSTPTEPEAMHSEQERPDIWLHGYKCGVLAARSAASPRNEETRKS